MEDNKTFAATLIDHLSFITPHAIVETAYDEPSFKRALRVHWDLIITDYHMHDFNALDVLNELILQGMTVPVIVVTGLLGSEARDTILRLGARGYLTKTEIDKLPDLIRAVSG